MRFSAIADKFWTDQLNDGMLGGLAYWRYHQQFFSRFYSLTLDLAIIFFSFSTSLERRIFSLLHSVHNKYEKNKKTERFKLATYTLILTRSDQPDILVAIMFFLFLFYILSPDRFFFFFFVVDFFWSEFMFWIFLYFSVYFLSSFTFSFSTKCTNFFKFDELVSNFLCISFQIRWNFYSKLMNFFTNPMN